jgi:hypothetical protein
MEPGTSWRRHCWSAARAALLPTLPIEIVRVQVKRAAEIGLDYKTYAGVRATSGHDIVAFLFSTNALRLLRETDRLREADAAKLAANRDISGLIAAQPPLDHARVRQSLTGQGIRVDATTHAPGIALSWADTRRALDTFLAEARQPRDGVLVIGATDLERDWVAAGRLAGFVSADRYFGPEMARPAG